MNRTLKFLLLLIVAVAAVSVPALAIDHVIVNSRDWRDVYSATQYAQLIGAPSNFLVSSKHSTILLYSIEKSKEDVQVISSRSNPFIIGYEGILLQNGYANPDELIYEQANLELARRLNDEIARTNAQRPATSALEPVRRFIIIDDQYGYNAISVASYAAAADTMSSSQTT
ncbi:MAG: hypothetical protein HC945_02735 [Nitrosarchaeum sp.]|nr:hypothetical protein [Nitrosarchaeum sp.]